MNLPTIQFARVEEHFGRAERERATANNFCSSIKSLTVQNVCVSINLTSKLITNGGKEMITTMNGKKNIYKKTLAMELIKREHNFLHSMRNRDNGKYQVYVFEETPELIRDMLEIEKNNVPRHRHENQACFAGLFYLVINV